MTTQNYLIIENNVVTNCVEWDGNTQTWTPPTNAIMLIQSTTPCMTWELNTDKTDFVLVEIIGVGNINDSWNGTVLTTDLPKPPAPQVVTTGTVTA